MLHPSYSDLMKIVNKDAENDTPVVNSRYSIVMATAKRAREIVDGEGYTDEEKMKPLSTAVKELNDGKITILPDLSEEEMEEEKEMAVDINDVEEELADEEE